MKKPKQKKRKRDRKPPSRQKPPPPSKEPFLGGLANVFSRTWKIFLGIAAGVGFVGTVLSVLPNIVVSSSSPMDPQFPLRSTPFIISNDGVLSVHMIRYSCHIRNAMFDMSLVFKNNEFAAQALGKTILWPKQKDNIPCLPPRMLGGTAFDRLVKAEIEIAVSYRPSFLFWRKETRFRFRSYASNSGQLYWLPTPVE
jgi:hypothetical protein